jgi:hypothetical protein
MSEFQYVAFRAIDGPVRDKDLDYMRQQSSRAEITPWAFANEYHYSDFRGNAVEMLRRGYDLHLHYANFGIRKLMIRLPQGLPAAGAAEPYFVDDSLTFIKNKQGRGGIVSIEPFLEAGERADLWDLDDLVDRLTPLRAELLDGDLRPLYLAHLAIASDDNHDPEESLEAPVPAGLSQLSDAQQALTDFYGLGDALVAAAAQRSPRLPSVRSSEDHYADWLAGQPERTKNAWLSRLLAEPNPTVRREILAEFHKSRNTSAWPAVKLGRTIAQLEAVAEEIASEQTRKSAEKAARARAKKLAKMAADPLATLHETERLVQKRSMNSYEQIASLLVDLRQALAGGNQASLAEQQAQKLRSNNPTLKMLMSELRKRGFLKK